MKKGLIAAALVMGLGLAGVYRIWPHRIVTGGSELRPPAPRRAASVLVPHGGVHARLASCLRASEWSKYKVFSRGAIRRPANGAVAKALPWMDRHREKPFFAWVPPRDAPAPYPPPEPFKSRYAG